MEELIETVDEKDMDIIVITEAMPKNAKTRPSIAELSVPGYDVFTSKTFETSGRGVYMMVKSCLKANPVMELTNSDFRESTWCMLKNDEGQQVLIGGIYRSPNSSLDNNNELISLLNNLEAYSEKCELLLVGDFNFPVLKWDGKDQPTEGSIEARFCDCLNEHFFSQMITEHTRIRNEQQPSVLDLLITNNEDMVVRHSIDAPLGKSDHASINVEIVFNVKKRIDKDRFQYRKADLDAIKRELGEVDWDSTLGHSDVEENWMVFKQMFKTMQDKYVPRVTGRPGKRNRQAWISAEVRNLVREKKAAYRRYRKNRTEENKCAYKDIRNRVKTCIKNDKRLFEQKLAHDAKSNPKVFWSYVNSKRKLKQGICELERDDGTMAVEDQEKAEVLNTFFASVFTKENVTNVPQVKKQEISNERKLVITLDQVRKKLLTMNENKSPGPDGFHPYMLKHLAEQLSYPIYLLFNQSLDQAKVPSDWRNANITAIFKKGDKKQPGNYRPVSLTSIVCKIMEQFMREAVMGHMTSNNLICKEQHGFLKGKTCITNLLESLDSWTESMDNRKAVDVVYLDFKKAFDKVPHKRLITKLRMYGMDNRVVDWIEDFLRDRRQRVIVNGEKSGWRDVSSGIPQGSVLGPSLFIVYINDLPETLHSESKIFADDTKVHTEVEEGGAERLQEDIDRLQEWSGAWQIQFNVDKCAVVHLGANNPKQDYYMKFGNTVQTIKKSDGEKDLGVLVDEKLMFSKHIEAMVQKANKVLGILKRSFKHVPVKEYVMLYKSIVRSILEYANVVWNPILERDKDNIEKIQRRFTKSITQYCDLSYSQRLQSLNLPTLKFRRLRGDLLQTYKIINKEDIMKDIFQFNTDDRTRGHSCKMAKTRNYSRIRGNFFSQRVVNPWNKLSEKAVTAKSMNEMKNCIDKSFEVCDKFEYKNW